MTVSLRTTLLSFIWLVSLSSSETIFEMCSSYFEMIAKYENGFAKAGKSGDFFKEGVHVVFPEFRQPPQPANVPGVQGKVISLIDVVLDLMYEGIRCGLYHSGITNGKILLTGKIKTPMVLEIQNQWLMVNPHLLVPKLKENLRGYVGRLREINNADLRTKFEARYDFDTRG